MNRSLFSTLDRCVIGFSVLVMVTVGLAYLKSHRQERAYWENQIAMNYQFPVSQVVEKEFELLTRQVAKKANSYALYEAIAGNRYGSLTRLFATYRLSDDSVDMVYVQNIQGIGIYSQSKVYSDVALKISGLLNRDQTVEAEASHDHGLLFVDGRIYMYASALIAHGDEVAGLISWVKEVNSDLTERIGQLLGHQLAFHFTSPSQQLLKVSYRNDIEIEVAKLQETSEGFDIEYQGRLNDGSVQPANLVLSIELMEKPSSLHAHTGWLMVFVLLIIWILWLQLRKSLLEPFKRLQMLVHDETELRRTEIPDLVLPRELLGIYHRVHDLYSNGRQQNVFNQQVINAIGETIITVNHLSLIEYANPAALEWLQLDHAQVIGQPLELLVTTRDNATVEVSRWLYETNAQRKRVQLFTRLQVVGQPTRSFDVEVVCQPVNLNELAETKSTAVILIRQT